MRLSLDNALRGLAMPGPCNILCSVRHRRVSVARKGEVRPGSLSALFGFFGPNLGHRTTTWCELDRPLNGPLTDALIADKTALLET